MIYPHDFEEKIGFGEIRRLLKEKCLSSLGSEQVDSITMSSNYLVINEQLKQIIEFRRIEAGMDSFPLQYLYDVREGISRLRVEGTYLEAEEVFNLRRSLDTINQCVAFLNRREGAEDAPYSYPTLQQLTDGILSFSDIVKLCDTIVDKFGRIHDHASSDLFTIRKNLAKAESSVTRTLYNILHSAQSEGVIEKDVTPTLRDGRLVIPVASALKRKINGIVYDESATGKTVYIEPTEVVEANNRIRELENEERREIMRILMAFSSDIRPYIDDILSAYHFLATIDFIRAKAHLAMEMNAYEPTVEKYPEIDWIEARHPLLERSLAKQNKKIVPLEITLTKEQHILIISGPNAGGKSVCLKTVGLLQYMLQCGLSIPISYRSKTGVFKEIMIDIGDEQNIENDLSTYSSHLLNMKYMLKRGNNHSLLLIDEFGGGTEPRIGAAIAESILKQFCLNKVFAVITTHYQNLKQYADVQKGVTNGAMLYDRHEMRPLFQLEIGKPGSSFAVEIARKIGIPEEVITDASNIVGSEYIQSDKYLQDIVRDKRYWENKRKNIHLREKELENIISQYEKAMAELKENRKDVLKKAKEQAEELLSESNRKIENTIREIREKQAEKENTQRLRHELEEFKQEIASFEKDENDKYIERKMRQITERQERRNKRKENKKREQTARQQKAPSENEEKRTMTIGDTVRIKGNHAVGTIESIERNMATIVFGNMRTKMSVDKLEPANMGKQQQLNVQPQTIRKTLEDINKRKLNFKQDIDVRGMRGEEAVTAIMYFIDDAILVGVSRVRILHGTGNGILRQLIRDYLSTVPNVSTFHDEHVQFGGAGITVVDIKI